MLWKAVDPDISSTASIPAETSSGIEISRVPNYCFIDFKNKIIIKDNNLNLNNREHHLSNNITHSNVSCSLICYPRIVLGLVHLNKIWKIDKFEIVTIKLKNQLSYLKDSLGTTSESEFRSDQLDLGLSSESTTNNCGSVK